MFTNIGHKVLNAVGWEPGVDIAGYNTEKGVSLFKDITGNIIAFFRNLVPQIAFGLAASIALYFGVRWARKLIR